MPTPAGSCDAQTNATNATIASNRVPLHGFKVAYGVRVVGTNPTLHTISMSAVDVSNNRRTYYNVPWANESVMWVCCPTSVRSGCSDPNDPNNLTTMPTVGTVGDLLVEVNWAANQALKVSGPKWPANAGDDGPYMRLSIVPTRIVVTGTFIDANGDEKEVSVNLRDPSVAQLNQTVHLNPSSMSVLVSKEVFAEFETQPPSQTKLEILTIAADVLEKNVATSSAKVLADALAIVASAIRELEEMKLTTTPPAPWVAQIQRVLPKFNP